jgi:hypothetical protein
MKAYGGVDEIRNGELSIPPERREKEIAVSTVVGKRKMRTRLEMAYSKT